MVNTTCVSDYFPIYCSSSSYCNGVYRNGYCSGSCDEPGPSGSSESDEERCKAEGYIYNIWEGSPYNGCGGHFQKYYLLLGTVCPYNASWSTIGRCGVCSDISSDNCASSHTDMIDAGKGEYDADKFVWFGPRCSWAK